MTAIKTFSQLKARLRNERGETNDYDARAKLYNRKAWRRASKIFLSDNPLCCKCQADGVTEPAIVTDHIEPHRGDEELFWDQRNWQPLCITHHNRKSSME